LSAGLEQAVAVLASRPRIPVDAERLPGRICSTEQDPRQALAVRLDATVRPAHSY